MAWSPLHRALTNFPLELPLLSEGLVGRVMLRVNEDAMMKLLVDKDWASSVLWVPGPKIGWASCDHHTLELPPELTQRCDYLSDWFETYDPGSLDSPPDWPAYGAYLLALAIDLKRYFGTSAQIFVRDGEGFSEIKGAFSCMREQIARG